MATLIATSTSDGLAGRCDAEAQTAGQRDLFDMESETL